MYLFFDTETNGLPKKFKGKVSDFENWPRVIQLAFIWVDGKGHAQEFEYMIYPDGWEVPREKFWIENNLSTERCISEGINMQDALKMFITFYKRSVLLIAHNIDFDNPVLGCEMLRYGIKPESQIAGKFCTMKSSTDICKIPSKKGGYKWPKLQELHKYLFGYEFADAHDALSDVRATAKCFFELKDRGLI